MERAQKRKTKRLYPFTNYSPKVEARLKRLVHLGERGTLRRIAQDVMIGYFVGLPTLFYRTKQVVNLSDEEISKLYPRAEIIKRGRGGVTIAPEAKITEKRTRLGRSRAPRITPKTPRLRR